MKVYTFNKTYEQRFEDYQNILLNSLGNEIEDVWKSYLSPVLETTGWHAKWCIPSKICKYFEIIYPEYVIVSVTDIDFDTLTATVEILQDITACELPDSVSDVDLIDLLPLVTQDPQISLPYMDITAMYLDQYRIFYKYLWWPWDEEEDSEWVSIHLQDRLKLYYELMNGTILFETASLINDMIVDAKSKYQQTLDFASYGSEEPETVCDYVNLSAELDGIKKKLVFYGMESARRKLEKFNRDKITHVWKHCLVIKAGTSASMSSKILEAAMKKLPDDCPINLGSNLENSKNLLFNGNTLLIGPGTFPLSSAGIIELGGEITGVCLSDNDFPILEDTGYERTSWLQFSINESKLSNLILKNNHKFIGTVLKKAKLELNNVIISGTNTKKENGFYLKSGTHFIARNCKFNNLDIVFRTMSDVNIVLENCTFDGNGSILTFIDNANVTMINCYVSNCSSTAIICKSETISMGESMNCLNNIPNFKFEQCKFENNKQDVQFISLNNNN